MRGNFEFDSTCINIRVNVQERVWFWHLLRSSYPRSLGSKLRPIYDLSTYQATKLV